MGNASNSIIGQRPLRPDTVDKVMGRANFGADLTLPGMLHGAVLRSKHAHARILSIDTSKAKKISGVKAIVTGEDFAHLPAGGGGDQGFYFCDTDAGRYR